MDMVKLKKRILLENVLFLTFF